MITRIKVENFKSLEKFEIENLSLFTCFIGLNGAGKTTLFQFFDFVLLSIQDSSHRGTARTGKAGIS